MRRPAAQVSLFAVSFLLGMLLVLQLFAYNRPTELTELSAQELSELIEALSAENRQLRITATDLDREVREYREAEARGESLLDVTTADLERVSAFAGLAPVRGQGIEVRVEGELDAIALNDLINELRNAGAEAIAVDDIRITAASVAVMGSRALEIDGVEVGRRFILRAIGSPEGLLTALARPGGTVAVLEQFIRAQIEVVAVTSMRLPATERSLLPEYGEASTP